MVDLLLLLFVAIFGFTGLKSKSQKYTPYLISIVFGFTLSYLGHNLLSDYILKYTNIDLAFSSIFAFSLLFILGSIFTYAVLLFFYHTKSDGSSKFYSKFSKVNFVSMPVIALFIIVTFIVFISELPYSNKILGFITKTTVDSRIVEKARNVIRNAGINPEYIKQIGKVSLSPQGNSENVIPLDFKSPVIAFDQSIEYEMLEKINQQRETNGLTKLTYTNQLSDIARTHSVDMLRRRYFAHINLDGKTSFDRLKSGGIDYGIAGENLAISEEINSAIKALMDSPTHRQNILNGKFKKTGIGIAVNQDEIMVITQVFTD